MIIKKKSFRVGNKLCHVVLKKEGMDYIVLVDEKVVKKTPNELFAIQSFNEI